MEILYKDVFRVVMLTISVICLSGNCRAASFDCAKAATEIEKAICAEKELSDLDESVAREYSDALKQPSPEGVRILKEGQRQWLKMLRISCTGNLMKRCLEEQYFSRKKALETAVQTAGPFRFVRADEYRGEKPETDDGEEYYNYFFTSLPHVDAPNDALAKRLNAYFEKMRDRDSSCDSGTGQNDQYYKIRYASDHAISMTITDWEYCDGTPHGHGGDGILNLVLHPAVHELSPAELFRKGSPWLDYLVRRCAQKLDAVGAFANAGHDPATRQEFLDTIRDIAKNTEYWSLSKDALHIIIAPYDVNNTIDDTLDVEIPWASLQAYLRPDAPVTWNGMS